MWRVIQDHITPMFSTIQEQYNTIAEKFSIEHPVGNQINRVLARQAALPYISAESFMLDLCCGDGADADFFARNGVHVIGIDASSQLVKMARDTYPNIQFSIGLAEQLPYENDLFDCVFSKYALQTSEYIEPIFNEVWRVLKPGGVFIYLVTHPIRQFLEKKKLGANYFKQEIVSSVILDKTITVHEPTHIFAEYFNSKFFQRFEMLDFVESFDPAAERVNEAVYPGFFLVTARKK